MQPALDFEEARAILDAYAEEAKPFIETRTRELVETGASPAAAKQQAEKEAQERFSGAAWKCEQVLAQASFAVHVCEAAITRLQTGRRFASPRTPRLWKPGESTKESAAPPVMNREEARELFRLTGGRAKLEAAETAKEILRYWEALFAAEGDAAKTRESDAAQDKPKTVSKNAKELLDWVTAFREKEGRWPTYDDAQHEQQLSSKTIANYTRELRQAGYGDRLPPRWARRGKRGK